MNSSRIFAVFISVMAGLYWPDFIGAQGRPKPAPKTGTYTVRGDVARPAPDAPVTFGTTVEKYISNYKINADGTSTQTLEIEQTCSTELCLEQLKKTKYEFNGDLGDVRLVQASITKPGGKTVSFDIARYPSRPTPQAEAAPGFSSMRELELKFEGLELKDRAHYTIAIETRKPTFASHFDAADLFPRVYEWRSIEINIDAPKGLKLLTESPGLDGGQIPSHDDRIRWRFRKQNLSALPLEAAMYDTLSVSPRLVISTYASYEDLGRAFWQGFSEKAVITPEIQQLADEITKGISDPRDQIAAIFSWANKNIRYLAVVLDRGGWVPHSTDSIYRNRYGDCKDYSIFIYTMLKAKGIQSVPALIRSDLGDWFPAVATTEYFNHAILYIPSLNLFADATAPDSRPGIVPQTLVGKKALLAGENSKVIEVPKDDPDANQVLSDIDITISENGDLKASSRNRYIGRSELALREIMSTTNVARSDLFVKMMLAFMGVNGTGRLVKVTDPHSVRDPFQIELDIEVKDFTTFLAKGKFELPVGLNMFTPTQLEAITRSETRNTSLNAGAMKVREIFRIQLPASVTPGELPAAQKLSNDTGEYTIEFKKVNGKIEILRELILKKDHVAPTDYAAFRKIVATSVEGLTASIPYSANSLLLQAKTRQLKDRTPPPAASTAIDAIVEKLLPTDEKKLTSLQVRQMEAKLLKEPHDIETRSRLLRYYGDVKETPAIVRSRTSHRVWFVRNRPDVDEVSFFSWFGFYNSSRSPEYDAIRKEWLDQLASNKTNKRIRLNAVTFIGNVEPEVAERILRDGIELDKNSFEFQTELVDHLADKYIESRKKTGTNADQIRPILTLARSALSLLKQERSAERDEARRHMLSVVSPLAVEAGDHQFAEELSRELVLDFGNDIDTPNFQSATHLGNTVLGRVSLARGDNAKAGEYLLISIKAPLRHKTGYFNNLDMSLARELFRKGEKKAVEEFLTLCLELNSFTEDPELLDDEIAAIKKWQVQMDTGIEPSFDFSKP